MYLLVFLADAVVESLFLECGVVVSGWGRWRWERDLGVVDWHSCFIFNWNFGLIMVI